jgi:hypothetical protein
MLTSLVAAVTVAGVAASPFALYPHLFDVTDSILYDVAFTTPTSREQFGGQTRFAAMRRCQAAPTLGPCV